MRLNLEAMGVIDFDAGTAAIDAVLVDSRLAHKFPITGSAALRAGFGAGPSFVLSVGGFNPHFAAPTTVPALERVTIALSSGNNPRLICEAYFAITSNTVQFGADASLYASAAGFSVEGDVGFDVLVQLVPLHFVADFHARLQLKRGSHNLFGVSLNGALEGPRPLRVSGKATFEILWCDFSVHFDTTLVKGEPPPLPPAVDVLAQLTQALASPSSWSTQRSATQTHGVALRSLPPAAADCADRARSARSAVRQAAGRAAQHRARHRDLRRRTGGRRAALRRSTRHAQRHAAARAPPLQASFAPAQFFVMSDDEKLAAPSFESMDAGCVFGDAHIVFDPSQVIPAPLEYEIVPITLEGDAVNRPEQCNAAAVHVEHDSSAELHAQRRRGARSRATGRPRALSQRCRRGARHALSQSVGRSCRPRPMVRPPTVEPNVRTCSEYQAAVKVMNRAGARWQVVPTRTRSLSV